MATPQQPAPAAALSSVTVATPGGPTRSVQRMPVPEYSGIYKLHMQASATLGNENLRELLQLPWGVGRNEWIAAKTVTLFEQLVQLVTVLGDVCNPGTCPRMGCGKNITYHWADETHPTPRSLPAIDYMSELIEWGHQKLSNPNILPQDAGPISDHSFSPGYLAEMKQLHKRMFRVYAHTYTHHFADFQAKGTEAELNYSFKHWLFFVREFDLVTDNDTNPLRRLIDKFIANQNAKEEAKGGRELPVAPRNKDNQIVLEPSRDGRDGVRLGRPAEAFQ